jgi:hypothetical protein
MEDNRIPKKVLYMKLEQQGWEVYHEIDGKMKWGRKKDWLVKKGGGKGYIRGMEKAPENSKKLSYSAHANVIFLCSSSSSICHVCILGPFHHKWAPMCTVCTQYTNNALYLHEKFVTLIDNDVLPQKLTFQNICCTKFLTHILTRNHTKDNFCTIHFTLISESWSWIYFWL